MKRIAVGILLVMASGCSDGSDDTTSATATAPRATNVPSSAPADDGEHGFESDEFGSPSPEAIEGDRALRSVSATHADCGSVITTSGAPTTMVPPPGAADGTVAFTETSCSTLMQADANDPVPTCG